MAVRRMRRTRARRLVQLAKPRVKAIKTKKSWEDLLRRAGGRVVVVMLGGEKSLMCHRFEPVFAELSKRKEFAQLLFAKVDVEKLKGIVDTSNVKQLPTFMCFRGGRLIETCEATSPAAVKQMLERVSQSTGIVRVLSAAGRLVVRAAAVPLRPVGAVLRPRLWKAALASPLMFLAFRHYLAQHTARTDSKKKVEIKKVEEYNDLVQTLGWRRAKQLQRHRWLVKTVREMKQWDAGVAVKDIEVDLSDVNFDKPLTLSPILQRGSSAQGRRQLLRQTSGQMAGPEQPGTSRAAAERWSARMASGPTFPSKYVLHPAFDEENMTREKQLQWLQEVKLRYSAFTEDAVKRWKADVAKALCLKSGSGKPEIDWAKLEFGEMSVKDFKRELLLRTGFNYDKERMDFEGYQKAWLDYLDGLREDTRKVLQRTRKPSPLTVFDYSRKSLYDGRRFKIFLGDPAPRPYFWK